jgi:hypothetical protein
MLLKMAGKFLFAALSRVEPQGGLKLERVSAASNS